MKKAYIVFKGEGIILSKYKSFSFKPNYEQRRYGDWVTEGRLPSEFFSSINARKKGFFGDYEVIPCTKEEYEKEFLAKLK
jgi:hypothetical protein